MGILNVLRENPLKTVMPRGLLRHNIRCLHNIWCGKLQTVTPKHMRLDLALHQATRSENLMKLFNAENHAISIKTVHGIDNAITKYAFDKFVANEFVYVPNNVDTERLIQLSCDNIDVQEATVDNKSHYIAHRWWLGSAVLTTG